MKYIDRTKIKTKFGKWLFDNMSNSGFTCEDIAKKLGITRQTIWNHVVGKTKPNFVCVIAYCWLFNQIENINDIWCLVEES